MRIWFHTFGCRVNQYETEELREKLLADGVSVAVSDFETADVCVVNTCTVTDEADKDALRLVRRIARRNPAARLIVTGCLVSRDPAAVLAAAPGATIVGNDGKKALPAMLGCAPAPEWAGVRGLAGRARAFLKVQDGCNMHCTYCIIPRVRPALAVRPYIQVESETRGLVARGYREIVLCGIRLGRYLSEDAAGKRVDFPGLLARLAALPGDFRLRLSSFEITDVTDRFIETVHGLGGRMCRSFHLPLQSGSDRVLKLMERWYSAGLFERRVAALRARFPEAGLFTDIMVGFPGETERDFQDSLDLLERHRFSGLHVFRFSARVGTPAAGLKPLPAKAVAERAERMHALDRRLRQAFAAESAGRERTVLSEGAEGLTEHFLRVSLDRDPGPGLHRVQVGPGAAATVH